MPINEAKIRSLASAESFRRGVDYFNSGAVIDLQQRGDTLLAQVEGSSYEPYEVTIELENGELVEAECTCPYDWGGYCKHIVAVLLSYLHQPDQVAQHPPVAELLAGLGREDLAELLLQILSKQPRLVDWVEAQLAAKQTTSAPQPAAHPAARHTPIDPTPFRKQAQSLFRGRGYDDYGGGIAIAEEMSELIDKAVPFINAGDGRNALLILEAITGPYVQHWFEFDDEGESATVFEELDPLLAEAILSADLSREERQAWAKKLTGWQNEIEDYGVEGFDAAIAAAEQGWDYPPLQRVLQGHITHQGAWDDEEAPWYADELAVARLNVLERQGRTTEYLYLAEAEGQTARYLTMLVKLGRSQEAVDYAMQYMATTEEALALAQALREHDQTAAALKIAEHGLTLHGETLALARWLRETAVLANQSDLALKAARTAFARSTSLEDYLTIEAVAGAAWPTVKAELFDQLEAAASAYGKLDIYLHEGLVDKAVKTIDDEPYFSYRDLERVVDAARQSHPDWVIRRCCNQAEQIMDAGKSQSYTYAIGWLQRARRVYLDIGRAAEWQTYLEGLITKHTRKYSLRPQLEKLR
jgi:uncharacterized Zn finger protein